MVHGEHLLFAQAARIQIQTALVAKSKPAHFTARWTACWLRYFHFLVKRFITFHHFKLFLTLFALFHKMLSVCCASNAAHMLSNVNAAANPLFELFRFFS